MGAVQPLKPGPLRAVVKNGRLILDEPTDLPEGGVVNLVPVEVPLDDGTDDLDGEERARLHAALDRGTADIEAGRTVPAEQVLEKLRARRR